MSKADMEPKLAQLMDSIPEIEGLIALDPAGKVVVGQTLTEMDLNAIAKSAAASYKAATSLGGAVGKGEAITLNINLASGSCCVAGNSNMVLVSIQGADASTSQSLIMRSLRGLLQ